MEETSPDNSNVEPNPKNARCAKLEKCVDILENEVAKGRILDPVLIQRIENVLERYKAGKDSLEDRPEIAIPDLSIDKEILSYLFLGWWLSHNT